MNTSTRRVLSAGLCAVTLLGFATPQSRADIVTFDLPELIGMFIHGQDPLSGFFQFPNVHAVNSLTLTITATGTAGADVTAWPIPAEVVLDAPGEYIDFEPEVLGPYGTIPDTSVHGVPTVPVGFLACIGCPQFYTLTGEIELSTHDIYPNLITLPTVDVTEAFLTLDADFCNHPNEPVGCHGFIGINDLNIVLGAWNQSVPPADPLADRSGDGYVGIDDLNWVLSRWNAGTPPGVNAVPEPAGFLMLSLLVGGVLYSKRLR